MGTLNMSELTLPEQSSQRMFSFFRALRDEDSFTILYELAHNKAPVAPESLSRTFGADVTHILDVLSRLQRLGVAARTGRRWVVRPWAKEVLEDIERHLEKIQFEVAQSQSTGDAESAGELFCASEPVGTYDGLWVGTASQLTPFDRRTGLNAGTGAGTQGIAEFEPETPDRGQNETSSHDYK